MVNQQIKRKEGPHVIDLSYDEDDDTEGQDQDEERLTSEDISELERSLPSEQEPPISGDVFSCSPLRTSTSSAAADEPAQTSNKSCERLSNSGSPSSSSSSSSSSLTSFTSSSSLDNNNANDSSRQGEGEVITIDEDLEEWTVKEVLDKRPNKNGPGCEYLLKWDNYDGPPTWEPEANCLCTKLIRRFESNLKKMQLKNQPPSQRIKVRKLVPEDIIGSVKEEESSQMLLVVKWVGIEEPELISLGIFRENYPQKLIDFLVKHVVWQN